MTNDMPQFNDPIMQVTEKEILESLEENGVFEGEIFISSDGKNTVHAKASTPEGRKAAVKWSMQVYEELILKYGTKANMWEKNMNGKAIPPVASSDAPKTAEMVCGVHGTPLTYHSEGKWGPWWSCSQKNADGSYCRWKPAKEKAVVLAGK
jgi:hypothetical protein